MADPALYQIEEATRLRLRDNWPSGIEQLTDFDLGDQVEKIVCPGVHVAAEISGFERSHKDSWVARVVIRVYLIFKHLTGTRERRLGGHMIVEGVNGLLINQNLGLGIDPIVPVRAANITDGELRAQAKIGYRCDFTTAYDVELPAGEDAAELLKIGARYFLQPDDGVVDSEDVIDLS